MPLIEKYAYPWKSNCHPGENFGMLINATPIGMGTVDSSVLPFEPTMIQQAKYICDVVVQPETTSFLQHGKNFGKITLSGAQIATIQAREQFSLYTGVSVPISLVQQAFAFARSD
jgi:shikimate dehydrogenase